MDPISWRVLHKTGGGEKKGANRWKALQGS